MILLIDDEKEWLEILERLLKKHDLKNYKIFSDYEKFLDEIRKNRGAYVVVIDHDLKSVINGLDLMEEIFSHSLLRDSCKVIVCSGQENLQIAVDYYENGCFYYVQKDDRRFELKFIFKLKQAIEKTKSLLQRIAVSNAIEGIIKDFDE